MCFFMLMLPLTMEIVLLVEMGMKLGVFRLHTPTFTVSIHLHMYIYNSIQ